MSNIQYAFVERARVPDRAALQASIDALGFDLRIHTDATPFTSAGFLPFTLNGEAGPGFEVQFEPAADVIGEDAGLQAAAAGRDACLSMAWHGSMKDLACVLIVSCALMKDFGAVVSYEGEPPQPLEALLAEIPGVLADAQAQAARDAAPPAASPRTKPWWRFW